MAEARAVAAAFTRLAGTPLPEAARVLATSGLPVFPCAPGGKSPIIRRGFLDATSDLAQVCAWWRAHPDANIGIATGTVSGLAVVDVDVHQIDGFVAYRRAERAGLVPTPLAVVRTPSGGVHAYFATNRGGQRSWAAGRVGVDFRGDGGYIIAPPSATAIDGRLVSYRVEHVAAGVTGLVDAERLRDFLTPRPASALRAAPASGLGGPRSVERLASWVADRGEGERNVSLFWAACRLAENGVPAAQARDVLVAAARQPGFGEREITRTVYSAYRAAATQTRPRGQRVVSSEGSIAGGFVHRDQHRRMSDVRGLA